MSRLKLFKKPESMQYVKCYQSKIIIIKIKNDENLQID
jgi:hypothetical protein